MMAALEKVSYTIPYLYMQCADDRLLPAVGIRVIEASRCDCAYWKLPLIADRSVCMYGNAVREITSLSSPGGYHITTLASFMQVLSYSM